MPASISTIAETVISACHGSTPAIDETAASA